MNASISTANAGKLNYGNTYPVKFPISGSYSVFRKDCLYLGIPLSVPQETQHGEASAKECKGRRLGKLLRRFLAHIDDQASHVKLWNDRAAIIVPSS